MDVNQPAASSCILRPERTPWRGESDSLHLSEPSWRPLHIAWSLTRLQTRKHIWTHSQRPQNFFLHGASVYSTIKLITCEKRYDASEITVLLYIERTHGDAFLCRGWWVPAGSCRRWVREQPPPGPAWTLHPVCPCAADRWPSEPAVWHQPHV